MPLKHPIRCHSAGFNHAGSRAVAQEVRLSPSCRAASGQRRRDEGGPRDDPSGRVPAIWLMVPVPGVTRRLVLSPHGHEVATSPRHAAIYTPTSASKRSSEGGNIGGRRRANVSAEDFDRYGWRHACRSSGNVAVVKHTARSYSAGMPRCVAGTAGFRTMGSQRDFRSGACPATTPRTAPDGARSRCQLRDATAREIKGESLYAEI
jgi:hypothetical protein